MELDNWQGTASKEKADASCLTKWKTSSSFSAFLESNSKRVCRANELCVVLIWWQTQNTFQICAIFAHYCVSSTVGRLGNSAAEPEPRAEIKLPLGAGAGAEITNCGSGSFLFTTDLKNIIAKKHGCWKPFFLTATYNFNPITWVKKGSFQGILYKYLEPESKEIF